MGEQASAHHPVLKTHNTRAMDWVYNEIYQLPGSDLSMLRSSTADIGSFHDAEARPSDILRTTLPEQNR